MPVKGPGRRYCKQLERAIVLAVDAHAGQVDKAGAPYILHPLRLMTRMKSDLARMTAVLHDVVEDTDITLGELRREGIPDPVVEAVDLLTHGPEDDYDAYIGKILHHPLARQVKQADLEDNMDMRRIAEPGEWDWRRMARYRRTWQRFQDPEDDPAPRRP